MTSLNLKQFVIIIAKTHMVGKIENNTRSLIKLERFGYNNTNTISLVCIFFQTKFYVSKYIVKFLKLRVKIAVERIG